MNAWRTAVLLCALAIPLASQEAAQAAAARTALESAATKGDARALGQALSRRGGDWFDVVLTVVAEPMPALEPTRALIAALPDPEKAGVAAVLDPLASGAAPARQAFSAAIGALTALGRVFGDTRSEPKNLAEAATLAEQRVKAAGGDWLSARGAVAAAMGRFETNIAELEPHLAAAAEKLATAGDRLNAALATALHARALADKREIAKALEARAKAQAALKALGAIEKGGSALRGALARVDLALAGPLFDEAYDDDALEACARARAAFKTADPMRDLEASAIEAAILIDQGKAAQAVEATKAHVNRIPQVKDKRLLARFGAAAADALRLSDKAIAGIEVLRKATGRSKELGMTPTEESPLRMAMALAYVQSGQNEAAHAALEVVSKFADEPSLKPLAKAAVLNRAVLLYSQGRGEEVGKVFERAATITLGGITLERAASAGPFLSIAEQLVDKGKPKDALKFIREVATAAEELGIRLEDVRIPTTALVPASSVPVHVRLGVALGNYDSGPDWIGFEPVFLVTERRLQELLAGGSTAEAGPADMMERLNESDRQVRKLRRSAAGARAPVLEDEAKQILAFRKAMVEEAWSRAPTFAMRRFPRAGSIRHARDNYCGVDGAIFGATVTAQTAYAFAFSRDRFVFSAVNVALGVHDSVAAMAALAKDPKCAPAAWVAASGPVWEHLIQKQLPVFEDKKWMVVCPDPSIDALPIEALVAADATSESFRTLPYLMQKIAVGRLPTSSLALDQRKGRATGWIPDSFAAVMLAAKEDPQAGVPFAQAFDPGFKDAASRTERAGVFKLDAGGGDGAESAPAKRPRVLLFGHGIPDRAVGWRGPTPAVICLLDPLSKEGASLPGQWMIRGVRAVIAPSGPIEKPVADELVKGIMKAFGRDGVNPVEAVTAAKAAMLSSTAKPSTPGFTDAHYHPAHWTQMQAWLINP